VFIVSEEMLFKFTGQGSQDSHKNNK